MVKRSRLEREWAASILHSLVTDTQTRFKNGTRLRNKMLAEMEKGGALSGYRPPWIKHSAHKVIAMLHQISTEFNDTYGADQASLTDMLDILATASNLIQKAQNEISPDLIDPKQPTHRA